jgi:hypothetical protein
MKRPTFQIVGIYHWQALKVVVHFLGNYAVVYKISHIKLRNSILRNTNTACLLNMYEYLFFHGSPIFG